MKKINYKDLISDFKSLATISPYKSLLTVIKVIFIPSMYTKQKI